MEIFGIALIILSAGLILLEMHTLTIYLLAVSAACIAGGVTALAGGGLVWTLSAMVITSGVALPVAHWIRTRLKNRASEDVSRDDIGHLVTVVEVQGEMLRVVYRGSTWSARLCNPSSSAPQPGDSLVISAREGSTLMLDPLPRTT